MGVGGRGTVLVTGGAGGIGLATARRLVRDGYEVTVCDVLDPPDDLAAAAIRCDLGDLDAAIPALRDALPGALRGIVNGAGIVERTRFGSLTAEEWERVFAVNARAPLLVVQGLADRLGPGSAIVNIASVESTSVIASSGPTTPVYAASKGALKNLTETLAVELGPRGVRVNAVAPGLIDTRLTTGLAASVRSWYEGITPLRRFGAAEDVADVIAFLMSDDARFVTGSYVVVDGGLTLGLVGSP